LEFRRGRGISVAGTPERGAVINKARDLWRSLALINPRVERRTRTPHGPSLVVVSWLRSGAVRWSA
jgi:hypothetical protein